MIVVLLVVAVLALAGVGSVAADRRLHALAEQRAAAYLTEPLGTDALVRVHGRRFLTQAMSGRYTDIEVTATGLSIGLLTGSTLHAHLEGVVLPLRDLRARTVRAVPVDHVHGELLIAYRELTRLAPVPGLDLRMRDGRLVASASLPIPGLSQLARLHGDAVLTITDGGGVGLRVRNLRVAGVSVSSLVLNQLVPALAFTVPLPPLPYGLQLERLTPTADGLEVEASARTVVLQPLTDVPPSPTS